MALRPSIIAGVADSGEVGKIQPSHMNPLTEPSPPAEGDIWFDVQGTSDDFTITIKIYKFSAWRSIVTQAFP